MELKDKVAVVTGGSRGIGKAVSEALAEAGARVAVVARGGERAASVAASLPGTGHGGYGCDVSDAGQALDMLARVETELGPVDILVNNAGVTRDNLLLRMKIEEWDEVMNINLKAAFILTKAVAKGMMKRREGSVINVSSVVGLMGNAGQANYAASKAGLIGFSKSVARELASRGVRCNVVAPGYVLTDMTAGLGETQTEALLTNIPMGRLGEPADIASVVRFLAGPWARYITGQVLAVDGGMAM